MPRVPRTLAPLAALVALLCFAAPAMATTQTATFDQPVTVKGYQVKQAMTGAEHPRVDGFITKMSVDIVDEDGKRVPIRRLMLHHIVFSKLGVQNPYCKNFTLFDADQTIAPALAQPLYGAGEERNKLELPHGYGLKLGKDDIWLNTWMLMNHRKKTDHAIIRWKVTYTTDENLEEVHPHWLDVKNCNADPIFNVPGGKKRGSTFSKSKDFVMPESGRIIGVGGHVHGGARNLTISEPGCSNRELMRLKPAWGRANHPFYHVRPILHEPGPIAVSQYASETGWPVEQGERIRLTANYDNSLPHTRVMGISLMYMTHEPVPTHCGATPPDAREIPVTKPHRTKPPRFTVPIVGIGKDGKAHDISKPRGRTVRLKSGAKIRVRNFYFSKRNVLVRRGARLRWDIRAKGQGELHNVTLASGPRGFASPNYSKNTYKYRFRKRGKYKIFCALHPVSMTEVVTVR